MSSQRLAVIIPAMNEADTLPRVLRQIAKLHPYQVIVVVNGSHDGTEAVARACGATVVRHHNPLGNDIGRAVGAFKADADIYLFTDADLVIPVDELKPFVKAIENGTDLALNGLDWLTRFPKPDEPSIARYFLNLAQRRRDLGLENALTVPHAISRRALNVMGKDALADPLLATTIAIDSNLKVGVVNDINVLKLNKRRHNHQRKSGEMMSEAYQRMHGDSVEALHYLLKKHGKRGGFANKRLRHTFTTATRDDNLKVSARAGKALTYVLSITRQSQNLSTLIRQLRKQDAQIVAILHDGSDYEYRTLARYHIPYLEFKKYLGHDVAFAIGSTLATGKSIVFHDTRVPIDADELEPFVTDLQNGKADIVLNNHGRYVGKLEGMHPVHIGNWYMNIVTGRLELTTSSLLLPPYGMNRRALEKLGSRTLMKPWVAQVKAVLAGLSVATAGSIDYLERIKRDLQPAVLDEEQMIGDILEGLHAWMRRYGFRGGFTDMGRRRYKLQRYGRTLHYQIRTVKTRVYGGRK